MVDFEAFGTQAEAIAFAKGMQAVIDLIDDDHAFVGEPELVGDGEWRVGYGYYC
jgi:hypothetical protein